MQKVYHFSHENYLKYIRPAIKFHIKIFKKIGIKTESCTMITTSAGETKIKIGPGSRKKCPDNLFPAQLGSNLF
jgi:hypothetical protein